MVKIASAPQSEFKTGSLDCIRSNRDGSVWNLKAGETSDDDCGPRKDVYYEDQSKNPAAVISPVGGKKATKSNKTNIDDNTFAMDKKSFSLKKIDGRGTGSPRADGMRKGK